MQVHARAAASNETRSNSLTEKRKNIGEKDKIDFVPFKLFIYWEKIKNGKRER